MSIQIIHFHGSIQANTTRTWPICNAPPNSSSALDSLMPVAGTFQNLTVHATTTPSGGAHTITLYKNGNPTSLTITLNGTTDASDTTHTVAVVASDQVGWRSTAPGGGNSPDVICSVEWVPTTDGVVLLGDVRVTINPPDPGYASLYDGANDCFDTVANVTEILPCAGSFVAASAVVFPANPGGTSLELSLYKNGVKQDGTGGTGDSRLTVGAGASSAYGAIAGTVAAGDTVYVKATKTGAASDLHVFLLAFQPTVAGKIIGGGNNADASSLGTSATYFWPIGQISTSTSDEAGHSWIQAQRTLLITDLMVDTAGGLGAGQTITATIRKNGADTDLTVTLTSSTPGGRASVSGTVSLVPGDTFTISALRSGTINPAVTGPMRYTWLAQIVTPITGSFVAGVNTTVTATRAAAFGLDGNTNVDGDVGKLKVYGDFEVTGTSTIPGIGGITQLTGDVTAGPGSGSQEATIANDAVTYAKMQNASDESVLLGRGEGAGAGNLEEIALGTNLSMSGTTLNAAGGGASALDDLTDVTLSAPSNGEFLQYDGAEWVNTSVSPGSGNATSTGAVGSEPGGSPGPATGDLYLPNNGYTLDRYSGSAWIPWGPICPLTPPVDGDFAWVNQGGASVDTTNGGIYLQAPANASASWRIRKKAAPAAPYTITVGFLPQVLAGNQRCAVLFRQSSDGKLVIVSIDAVLPYLGLAIENWTNETTFSATAFTRSALSALAPMVWVRIADNNTNRIVSYSTDGQHFIAISTISRTNFLTADEIGFAVSEQSNARAAGMTLLSWTEA